VPSEISNMVATSELVASEAHELTSLMSRHVAWQEE
jgi:hypothetical protein